MWSFGGIQMKKQEVDKISHENWKRKWEKEKILNNQTTIKVPENKTVDHISNATLKDDAETILQGNIVDPFIKEYLKGQIAAERLKLLIGMALTILFKHQWVLWIILIVMHIYKTDKLRTEAQKIDIERLKKQYERMGGKK